MLLPCDFGQRFREIGDCESSREDETLTKQKRWFVVGCSEINKQKKNNSRTKHWLFLPATNGANERVDSSLHHTFNARASRAHRLVRKEGRAISRRFTGARAQPKHTLAARHHTQKRPIRDRHPTHGGPDGLLSNVATACR